MTQEEYAHQVDLVLSTQTEKTKSHVLDALALIPPMANRIVFEIFVDQDGEGFLDIRLGLEGPNQFVLNKAIEANAHLFGTKMTEEGLHPPLPLMCSRHEAFSVHDTLTNCAAAWIHRIWNQIDHSEINMPVDVISHEGYGTVTPLGLQ